ncbi:MAG: hypothetical protein EOO77_10850 [Oxalobacteraceae bacterium]|nr:MAG: hypothetical protein EOO77_10850 [Oxalobacteraceae bacterium]
MLTDALGPTGREGSKEGQDVSACFQHAFGAGSEPAFGTRGDRTLRRAPRNAGRDEAVNDPAVLAVFEQT